MNAGYRSFFNKLKKIVADKWDRHCLKECQKRDGFELDLGISWKGDEGS